MLSISSPFLIIVVVFVQQLRDKSNKLTTLNINDILSFDNSPKGRDLPLLHLQLALQCLDQPLLILHLIFRRKLHLLALGVPLRIDPLGKISKLLLNASSPFFGRLFP